MSLPWGRSQALNLLGPTNENRGRLSRTYKKTIGTFEPTPRVNLHNRSDFANHRRPKGGFSLQ
jgi:hypothetical protein